MRFLMITLATSPELPCAVKFEQIAAVEAIDAELTVIHLTSGDHLKVTDSVAQILKSIEAQMIFPKQGE